ncbi:hypothetical protein [Sphingopyxis flava]|uniref:BNR repeat-like domain-containing protein n=1 Tax=Sphingopyxis flava TaxID=1507287 RepID=A0A1T5A152_9SPHN|nr:hypothetical protein [Sphingopyxis flava]SKB28761.1 hypothetical protein SAMN06295937_100293 [Sphingopyxis flava]
MIARTMLLSAALAPAPAGRVILVRFIITHVSADEAHFEQAYSADGGVTWEDNWIAVDTRLQAA